MTQNEWKRKFGEFTNYRLSATVIYLIDGKLEERHEKFTARSFSPSSWEGVAGWGIKLVSESCLKNQGSYYEGNYWNPENYTSHYGGLWLHMPGQFPVWTRPVGIPIKEGQIDTIIFHTT